MKKPSITLDAGHGDQDSGAVGPTGLREKDVALKVVLLLGGMLTLAGVDVFYTRKTDKFIELSQRAKIANELGTDLFLSIHCNSGEPGKGEGFEVFTTPGETASDKFATALFLPFAAEFPEKRKRIDDRDGDPDKEANFAVLRLTHMPAALFELEFIHTPAGESWLRAEANQIRCAEALAHGVIAHLGLRAKPSPEELAAMQQKLESTAVEGWQPLPSATVPAWMAEFAEAQKETAEELKRLFARLGENLDAQLARLRALQIEIDRFNRSGGQA